MNQTIRLVPERIRFLRHADSRMMSYNIEMTEVTGGTFWKEYTPGQIAGTESFPPMKGFEELAQIMQWYDPIDLRNEKLRTLAAAFGPCWIRVSGTWATKTYYDFDGHTGGKAPEGFQSVLTREQWSRVLDFVKAVNGKLLVSVGNCAGNHPDGGALDLSQTKLLFDFSRDYGVPIDAAEFMNEPNMLTQSGAPAGYTAKDFVRDQDLFFGWIRENYPDCLLVGPCTTDGNALKQDDDKGGSGIADVMPTCSTDALMDGAKYMPDVFSYHYYNGVSERLASLMPSAHWPADQAASEPYLAMAERCAKAFAFFRDKYCPGAQMWVTESGDAGGGGDTWASTYLDVLRTLNELGSFSQVTDGVIFHNTLASSDYGFLRHGSFDPRPNYFAVLLWNLLMGTEVYDAGIPTAEGSHIFVRSRADKKPGKAVLAINNAEHPVELELPAASARYTLSAESLRGTTMLLNGRPLTLGEDNRLPAMDPVQQQAGIAVLEPGSCTFFMMD